MKKFVECAITNRKDVKGTTLFTANAFSAANELLGKFVVKNLEAPNSKGIFLKYIPCKTSFEASKEEGYSSLITSLQLVADNQLAAQEYLYLVKDSLLQNPNLPPFIKLLITLCVSVEDSTIRVSPIADALTEFINKHMVNNGWFGAEVKVAPELIENVTFQVATVSPASTPFEPKTSAKVGSSWYCEE